MDHVTWRLEIPAGWGERLDPTWLPDSGTEGWRQIFRAEDTAGRLFADGGGSMTWKGLAQIAHQLAGVLDHYRMQWGCADEVACACPVAADDHLTALAVPPGLRPPRRSTGGEPWRVCVLGDGRAVSVGTYASVDLAEGAAVAHRTLAADLAVWAEPDACGSAPVVGEPGWLPAVDTDLRLTAFAAEAAVGDLAAAAATGHIGPDVLDTRVLCTLGHAAHYMIREYRTLFRSAWAEMDACSRTGHDDEAESRMERAPEPSERGPGGSWDHVELAGGRARVVNRHPSRAAAAASVAAARATDGTNGAPLRWTEPAVRAGERP